jgi:PhnB protein
MQIQPYLFFNGRCDEALAFYGRAVGAKVKMVMRFKDNPDPSPSGMLPPGWQDKVMHANARIGESDVLLSDGHSGEATNFQGFGLTLTVPDEAEAERAFAALAEGGQVRMPMAKTFFSPQFGMLMDRFGVLWMVYVAR